ncbi:T9SS type A sorting domain-containing protein [Flavobacterium rakeshii]|uniref:T9SS type A sorting domain-containing protein n=1 Tax=Flavobacterium rakeshii TaxID=1038845 RepID=A0A6N8HFD1_9FLAO|nr:T9SS type A sorting domain-containing protein [Flavobacterium rakeshii]MUV04422.1 T9SS type A sorting domain-containing protein [Flavobacterium rakeshii]
MRKNYLKTLLLSVSMFTLGIIPKAHAQDTYTVQSIAHQTYSASTIIDLPIDDRYSDIITIPFNFTFFGEEYNQFIVSNNGYIDFRTELATTGSSYDTSYGIPSASFSVKNSILACFHDMDNSSNEGSITYDITGNAPYRKFVLIFDNHPHFSTNCFEKRSSFQVILYETLNIIDVQILRKDLCVSWNGGRANVGIINDTGLDGYAAPGRNSWQWQVEEGHGEGWRFTPQNITNVYTYIKCDTDADGIETFDFTLMVNDLNPNTVFYSTQTDAINQTNAFTETYYTNITPFEATTIYARYNDDIIPVVLNMADCNEQFDNDNVATIDEDLNGDGNLANDDTDSDGIPDFLDSDDDNDIILTSFESVFDETNNAYIDSDTDGVPDYLDNDDDGDGVPTALEDFNQNGSPLDDDNDNDGILNYLDTDDDGDGVLTVDEDLNLNGNPADDDTDNDGIPNHVDNDDDGDNILTVNEDVNNNDNVADDDTDNDGIPNYLDNDDDGDSILTIDEDLNLNGNPDDDDTDNNGVPNYLDIDDDGDGIFTPNEDLNNNNDLTDDDTDDNGIPNYLDNDDDGDGILTIDEDINQNGDPTDDDSNNNNIPDYLDFNEGLSVNENTFKNDVRLYPNPASGILNIDNTTGKEIEDISIYSINGVKVQQNQNVNRIDISNLQTGIYIVKMLVDNKSFTYKLLKN